MKTSTTTKKLNNKNEKLKYINDVWNILSEAYSNVEGGLFFNSKEELLTKTALWKVVVFDSQVIAVTIYKVKHGLKLVALAIHNSFKNIAKKALARIIKSDLKKCWMELSEAAERFIISLGGDKFIIPSHLVAAVLNKEIRPTSDGVHYIRNIMGIEKEKVLLGTIKLN